MRPLLIVLFGVLLLSGPVLAQTPPSPAKPTLAATLAQTKPPAKGVALAVGADTIMLPADNVLPGTAPTVTEVADAFGRSTQRFGLVTAVAPPTMVVLNTAPGEPNIYAGMPALDALTLLAASLTDAQWAALTSEQGLAVSALDARQRQMFSATLSHDGMLLVMPDYTEGEKRDDKDKQDLTDRLPQAHLRMGQSAGIVMPIKDHPGSSYGGTPIPPAPGAPRQYEVTERTQEYGGENDTVYGAPVRGEVPNVPKRGQMDFSASALQPPIPLAGLKTVGDLVYAIGRTTHTEVYADPHLEGEPLTVLGASSAPAADLLQALAFCLTGTFRQVGPAYVLTDDIMGIGTRRQIWSEFEQDADALRRSPVEAATQTISARHSAGDLPWFGDPGAFSPEQMKRFAAGPEYDLRLPLSQLTPTQQAMAQRGLEHWNGQVTRKETGNQPLTTDGDITLRPGLSIQLLIPGLDTPIDMNINSGNMDALFLFPQPYGLDAAGVAANQAREKTRQEEIAKHAAEMAAAAAQPPSAAMLTLLKTVPRRAVLVHSRTAKEVDADVAAMQKLGLNELWLDVFSGGAAHVPGSALSPAKPLPPGENDILTEALTKTRGTGIRVFPVLDLLFWGQAPPAQDADLNVLGETSAQAAARWQQRKATLPPGQRMPEEYTLGGVIPDWSGVAVNPAGPDVRPVLTALVKTLAARPGVAGLVWRDTDPPGYDTLLGGQDTGSLRLGYQEGLRVAFLRRYHADPIDVFPAGSYQGKANTNLPYFSTDSFSASQITSKLDNAWVQFRRDANLDLLRGLYAAADPPGAPGVKRVPILLKQRRQGRVGHDYAGHDVYPPGWYGTWDDPCQTPPTLHSAGEDDTPGQPPVRVADEDTQTRQQSQAVLTPITADTLRAMSEGLNQPRTRAYLQSHPMPGFVLDLASVSDSTDVDPLVTLAKTVMPTPAAKTAPPLTH